MCVCVCVCVWRGDGKSPSEREVGEGRSGGVVGEAPSVPLITRSFTGSPLKQTNPSRSNSLYLNKALPPLPEFGKFKVQEKCIFPKNNLKRFCI